MATFTDQDKVWSDMTKPDLESDKEEAKYGVLTTKGDKKIVVSEQPLRPIQFYLSPHF